MPGSKCEATMPDNQMMGCCSHHCCNGCTYSLVSARARSECFTTLIPSSELKDRRIQHFEKSLVVKKIHIRAKHTRLIAITTGPRLWGFAKLGMTPGGGMAAG